MSFKITFPFVTYDCPCCEQSYKVQTVIVNNAMTEEGNPIELPGGRVWVDIVEYHETPEGERLVLCSTCNKPCCPRCVCIFGEGLVVCTRCTTCRNCNHSGESYGG